MTQRWLLYGRQGQRQGPSSTAQPVHRPHPGRNSDPQTAALRTEPGDSTPPLNLPLALQTRPRAAQAAKAQSTRAVRGSVVVRAAVRSNWLPGNDFPAHVRALGSQGGQAPTRAHACIPWPLG